VTDDADNLSRPAADDPAPQQEPDPRRGPSYLLSLLILVVLVSGVLAFINFVLLPQRKSTINEHHQTKWPNPMEFDERDYSNPHRTQAIQNLEILAAALLQYREGPMGGGLRWPQDLDELKMLGLLDDDYEFTGILSGAALVYQPEMPPSYAPERWALVHDVEVGWIYPRIGGRPVRGAVSAAVILGDGTVELVEGDDIQLYGGLRGSIGASR